MKVCVIHNPRASGSSHFEAIRQFLSRHKHVLFLDLTSPHDLLRFKAEAARHRYHRLVVAGGDGTIHTVVNALSSRFPRTPLAVLPLGTGNDLCRALDIPLDPMEAVKLLKSGRKRTIDLIQIEGDCHRIAVNVVTGGFSGRIAEDVTSERKEFWGPFAYFRGIAGPVAERLSHRLSFRFDEGTPEEHDVLNLVIANGRSAAGGLLVAPRASFEDGLLDIIIVPSGTWLDHSVIVARLMAGDYDADECVIHRRARRVELTAATSIPLSVDGEVVHGKQFTFTVIPKSLQLIVGPNYQVDPSRGASPDEPEEFDRTSRSGIGRTLFGVLAAFLVLITRLPRYYSLGIAFSLTALIGFLGLAGVVVFGDWQAANEPLRNALAAREFSSLTTVALGLTAIGNWNTFLALTTVSFIFLAFRRRYLDAATLLLVVLGNLLIEVILKNLYSVSRPEMLLELPPLTSYSFPSGHAIRVVGLLGYLAWLIVSVDLRSITRWVLFALSVTLALSICWTRIFLGYHYPGDVLAGFLISTAWLIGCIVARHHARIRLMRKKRISP